MTIWEQLGIGATKDIAVIRSAYAAKAKELHPEEHPEEFQQLQKAYKTAIKYAKNAAFVVIKAENPVNPVGGSAEEAQEDKEIQEEGEEPQAEKEQKAAQTEEESEGQQKVAQAEKEQMFEYDYGEIREETASDQFFQEFFYIAWNPWLLNNRICWELFLHRPRYAILFEDGAFRENLVKTMSGISGWHRNTIRYFDGFLKGFQNRQGKKAETDYFWWRWKRSKLWNKGVVTTERWISKEQKDMQAVLLSAVRKKCGIFPKGKKEEKHFFQDKRAVEAYLQIYLERYALKNSQKLEKMYNTNRNGKNFVRSMLLSLLFWVCLIAYINLTGDVPKKQTEQEKRQEEWKQEREENLKKYLEEYDYNESYNKKVGIV